MSFYTALATKTNIVVFLLWSRQLPIVLCHYLSPVVFRAQYSYKLLIFNYLKTSYTTYFTDVPYTAQCLLILIIRVLYPCQMQPARHEYGSQ